MTKVKICGIRKLADALVAAEAGADMVGLVFVPGRRRCLEPGAARGIVEGLRASGGPIPEVVGLFADQPLKEVSQIMESCGLDLAQLCGNESLEYCRRVPGRVIKVVHVDPRTPEAAVVDSLADLVQAYRAAGHLVTLDRLVEGLQGGTGHRFNWGSPRGYPSGGSPSSWQGGFRRRTWPWPWPRRSPGGWMSPAVWRRTGPKITKKFGPSSGTHDSHPLSAIGNQLPARS